MAIWHKYPYTDLHDLNLDWIIKVVKEMKEKFDSIDFDYILNTLTDLKNVTAHHTEQIGDLQTAIDGIGQQIAQLAQDLEDQGNDIEALQSQVNGIGHQITNITNNITNIQNDIRDIKDDIVGVNDDIDDIQNDITGIGGDIDSLDVRVTNLESATYGTITPNPINVNFSYDMRDLDGVDYEIVRLSSNYENDDIYVDNGLIKFYHEETRNECKLVLKNVLTDIDSYVDIDNVVLNLGFLLLRAGAGEYQSYSNGLTISQLLTGYSGNEYFRTIKLVRNDNGCFDLEIRQYPQSFYLRISLCMLFISFGSTPMTGNLIKDFIGSPTQNLVGIIKKNAASTEQINLINMRINQIEQNMVDDTEFTLSQQQQDQRIQNNRTGLIALDETVTAIDARTQAVHYTDINDVFSGIDSNIAVLAFDLRVTGKIAHMYSILCNIPFDVQHFNQILLGTVRPAIREKIRPKEQVFSRNIAYLARWNGSDWVCDSTWGPDSVTLDHTRNLHAVLSPDVGVPMNLIRNLNGSLLDPNTLWLAVDDYVDTRMNSAIIDMTWNVS